MIRVGFRATPDDPEKLVTPGVIFVNARHPKLAKHGCEGFCLFIGWWHWSASICIGRAQNATKQETEE